MSNIFRDSESLGKSNGEKWSHIWTFLFGSVLKSPFQKKFFCCWFCLGPPSYGIGATIRISARDALSPVCGIFFINLGGYTPHVVVFDGFYCLFDMSQAYCLCLPPWPNLRPLLSITFPQRFRKSKNFEHWTLGRAGKKTVKQSEKHRYQKNPAQ